MKETDYNDHTDPHEQLYKTILADISKIKDGNPVTAHKEGVADWSSKEFMGFDLKNEVFRYDVRSCDISKEDLSVIEDANDLSFDSNTIWPKSYRKALIRKRH
jgi:hypothetical protein